MDELLRLAHAAGYDKLTSIIPDATVHHFDASKKKSGWYVAFQNFRQSTGEVWYLAVIQDWVVGETDKISTLKGKISRNEQRFIDEKIKAAQAKQEAYKKELQETTSAEAQAKWDTFASKGYSPYLLNKQVDTCPGLNVRFDRNDVIVPIFDASGKLWSLQRITYSGSKYFMPGGRIKGCYHTIGSIADSEKVLVCEGLSTGASLHMASGFAVVVAFNAGNLVEATIAAKQAWPTKPFLICGDNDLWTEKRNPGKEAAEEAAKRSLSTFILPKFAQAEKGFTDFNDLHVRESLAVVREQVLSVKVENHAILAYGFNKGVYYFSSTQNRQLSVISAFTKKDLLSLMPLTYWETFFPTTTGKVNWDEAISKLMDTARKVGVFNPTKIRGAGTWLDAGRVVVNMGDHLIVDNLRMGLDQIKGDYFYVLSKKTSNINPQPLSVAECRLLTDCATEFKWGHPSNGVLLAGWLVASRLCGALPIRPHVWLTGESQAGKSTLFKRLINPILNGSHFHFEGNTTEAGVRQTCAHDAMPVIFDEFETTESWGSSEKIQTVLDLLRNTFQHTNGMVVKGGSNGQATAYNLTFCALVSSIRIKLNNDADKNRFAVLELAPHCSDKAHWAALSKKLATIDEAYSRRLFARSLRGMDVILRNFEALKLELMGHRGARFGDLYGMLLGCYGLLLSDEPLSGSEITRLCDLVLSSEQHSEVQDKDHDQLWEHITLSKVSIHDSNARQDMTVGEVISEVVGGRTALNKGLQRYGLKVDSKDPNYVWVAHNHPELKKICGGKWAFNIGNSLKRREDAVQGVTKILSKSIRCTYIKHDISP